MVGSVIRRRLVDLALVVGVLSMLALQELAARRR